MSSYVRTSRKTKAVNGLFEVQERIYGITFAKERTDVACLAPEVRFRTGMRK